MCFMWNILPTFAESVLVFFGTADGNNTAEAIVHMTVADIYIYMTQSGPVGQVAKFTALSVNTLVTLVYQPSLRRRIIPPVDHAG